MRESDHYTTLGVDPDATSSEIRAAFRRLVRQRHPDTSWGTSDDGAAREVIAADRVLRDPVARARYDAARRQHEAAATDPEAGRPHQRVRCPSCRGAGWIVTAVTCTVCGGHPEVTVLERHTAHVERCRSCAGRGRTGATQACPQCGGTGGLTYGG